MKNPDRKVWKQIAQIFPPDAKAAASALTFFRDYETLGYIPCPITELLRLDLPVIADFFRRVSLMHSGESPVYRRRDSRWMSTGDYALVNIRATGVDGKLGSFLSAAILLPSLRVQGIVLAPVTRGVGNNLTTLESHVHLREELADQEALNRGVGLALQMRAFAEAAHLLGLVLGYDLDYRVDPFATVVLKRPEFFLWTKNGEPLEEDEEKQRILRQEVRVQVAALEQEKIPLKRENIAAALSREGLASIPCLDGSGRTPLAFRFVSPQASGEYRDAALSYWGHVFDHWRQEYNFDFLVLRGTHEPEGGHLEIPNPSLVGRTVALLRREKNKKNIGIVVESSGWRFKEYAEKGVDLILDNEGREKIDQGWIDETFRLEKSLQEWNKGKKQGISVPMVINPGNKEHRPYQERAVLKRFVARFLREDSFRRPLWETMGALEGACGYNEALKSLQNLTWLSHLPDAERAQNIEKISQHYHQILGKGKRIFQHSDSRVSWWVTRFRYGLQIALIVLEGSESGMTEALRIDYSRYHDNVENAALLEHDFQNDCGTLRLQKDTVIDIAPLSCREFRLFVIMV